LTVTFVLFRSLFWGAEEESEGEQDSREAREEEGEETKGNWRISDGSREGRSNLNPTDLVSSRTGTKFSIKRQSALELGNRREGGRKRERKLTSTRGRSEPCVPESDWFRRPIDVRNSDSVVSIGPSPSKGDSMEVGEVLETRSAIGIGEDGLGGGLTHFDVGLLQWERERESQSLAPSRGKIERKDGASDSLAFGQSHRGRCQRFPCLLDLYD
jgi:hypothetical protein